MFKNSLEFSWLGFLFGVALSMTFFTYPALITFPLVWGWVVLVLSIVTGFVAGCFLGHAGIE